MATPTHSDNVSKRLPSATVIELITFKSNDLLDGVAVVVPLTIFAAETQQQPQDYKIKKTME